MHISINDFNIDLRWLANWIIKILILTLAAWVLLGIAFLPTLAILLIFFVSYIAWKYYTMRKQYLKILTTASRIGDEEKRNEELNKIYSIK